MESSTDITVNVFFMKSWKKSDLYCGRLLIEILSFTNFYITVKLFKMLSNEQQSPVRF